jgi:hypothetical protein
MVANCSLIMFDIAKRKHVETAFFSNIRVVHMTSTIKKQHRNFERNTVTLINGSILNKKAV